jgi:hypothetical protein
MGCALSRSFSDGYNEALLSIFLKINLRQQTGRNNFIPADLPSKFKKSDRFQYYAAQILNTWEWEVTACDTPRRKTKRERVKEGGQIYKLRQLNSKFFFKLTACI